MERAVPDLSRTRRPMSRRVFRGVAIVELTLAGLMFAFEFFAIQYNLNDFVVMGTGIWYGLLLLFIGALGLLSVSSRFRSSCLLTTVMVMDIIACCLSVVCFGLFCYEFAEHKHTLRRREQNGIYDAEIGKKSKCSSCDIFMLVKNGVCSFMSIVFFILTIVQASFCCYDMQCPCCMRGFSLPGAYTESGEAAQADSTALEPLHQIEAVVDDVVDEILEERDQFVNSRLVLQCSSVTSAPADV